MYERAFELQDLLDDAHSSPELLLKALETAIQNQTFYVYVDRIGAQNCPHTFHRNCLIAIQKHAKHLSAMKSSSPSQMYITSHIP